MPKTIEPELQLITKYLSLQSKEMFVIPEYQRKYSWTITECDKLWQDIETYKESKEEDPYFFGTIIADCSEADKISLIDGQQRTITFILLLKALLLTLKKKLEGMPDDSEVRRLKIAMENRYKKILDVLYRTNDDSRLDIMEDWNKVNDVSLILLSNSINEIADYKNDLQVIWKAYNFQDAQYKCYKIPRKQKDNKYTNFFKNFKFFYDKLDAYDSPQINSFAAAFLEKCQIIEIRSWNTEQAVTMFNSLNSTGMPLSDADIISARLFANATSDTAETKNEFIEKWEEITKLSDELSRRNIINLDSLLQQYMYIIRATQQVYMKDGKPDVTTPGLRRYYMIENSELLKQPLNVCDEIGKLERIWEKVSIIPVVKLLLKFNENIKLYFIAFLNRYEVNEIPKNLNSDHDIFKVSECLIKLFTLLEIVETGYSSAKFKTFLFAEIVKFVNKEITIEEIQIDFQKHIENNWKIDEIKMALFDYEKNVLVFLNEYLYAKENNLDFDFSDSVNVEHIMPKSGHNLDLIRKDAGIENQEEFDNFVNQLGNKILLEEDINKSISNDWFRTKIQNSVKEKKGYKDSCFGIASALVDSKLEKWRKENINEETENAINRIINFIFSI